MWPMRAAIRPVPAYAVVPRSVVSKIEDDFYLDEDLEAKVDRVFHTMERAQPAVARFVERAVDSVPDETAQALGLFLGVAVYSAYERAFGNRLVRVSDDTFARAQATLECDEEIRRSAPDETLESDDVVAMTQPHLVSFVRSQLDSAIEAESSEKDPTPTEMDIEAVESVYRTVLVLVLSLSESIEPPRGFIRSAGLA